ncbi:MAG: Hpt domain-containing protein [Spirochaetales bacterium]|nr:Hpt domain-containing protein [Spirochaetales bacterium]
MNKFRLFLFNLITSGTYSEFEIGKRSRIIFLNTVMLIGIPFLYYFSINAFINGEKTLGLSTLITGSIVVIVFLIVRGLKAFEFGTYFIVTTILMLYGYLVYSGGEGNSGFLWLYSFPLIAIFLLRIRAGSIYAFVLMAWAVTVFAVPAFTPYEFSMNYAQRIVGVYMLIYFFAITYEIVRSTTHRRMGQINRHLHETTAQLSSAKSRTDTIMQNVEQGIFLLDKKLCFASEHSRYMSRLFNKSDFGGMHIIDVLGPYLDRKDALATRDYLELFFKDEVNKALLKDINPLEEVEITLPKSEGKRRNAWLRFYFEGISSPEGDPMIIGLVNNISEEKELQKLREEEKNARTRNVETLFSVLHTEQSMLAEFIGDCDQELTEIRKLLEDRDKPVRKLLTELFQRIHSMKGNAVLLELNRFAESAHALEEKIKDMLETGKAKTEGILDLIYDTASLEEELNDIRIMIKKLQDFQAVADAETQVSSLLVRTIQQGLKKQTELEGKEVKLDITGFDPALIPDQYRKILKDVLVQMVRNAVSHGIESAEERSAAGKTAQGNLNVSTDRSGSELRISVTDDGRGIIPARILEAAGKMKSFAGKDLSGLSGGQVMALIFHPGFSTKSSSDLAAGRGIGMSLIKTRIEEAGGKLKVRTAPGKYTEFNIIFPVPA